MPDDDLEGRIVALAERSLRIKAHCAGEDATRIYLVMPFLELLGYDAGDPSVIVPEPDEEINFAVIANGEPSIAVEAVGTARPVNVAYERLRSYCDRHRSARLGIATNGVIFEVYVDSQRANVLDDEPFMRFDLAEVATGKLDPQALEFLALMRSGACDPDAIARRAFEFGLLERLKSCVLAEFRNPSEALCKLLLEQIGIRGVRKAAIDQHYRPILRSAMEQAIVVPVVQALRRLPAPAAPSEPAAAAQETAEPTAAAAAASRAAAEGEPAIGERLGQELAAFGRTRRRNA